MGFKLEKTFEEPLRTVADVIVAMEDIPWKDAEVKFRFTFGGRIKAVTAEVKDQVA